jgi:PAS domain-containing protein
MNSPRFDWVEHYPAAVSVCDTEGTLVAMNQRAAAIFAEDGGEKLIGTSLFACHPEPANVIIRTLLREQRANTYFTEKNGRRKLVHQAPWYDKGRFAGLVETVIVLPAEIATRQRS